MRALAHALLAALLALLVLPAAAAAHATVLQTTPGDLAVVVSQPRNVQMRFSEPVDLGPGSLRLLDATGKEIKTGDSRHAGSDRATAVLALPGGLAEGTYVIAWRVSSADSHPVTGAFSFSIGGPSAFVSASGPGESGAAVKVAGGIARGIAFAGFALAVGGACVLLLLWPEGRASRRGRRFVWTGIGALAFGTFAVLLLQGPYAGGGLGFTLSTRFGQALLARLVLTLAFAALVTRALRDGRPRPIPLALCVAGLVVTWTLTDHSRTGVQPWLGIPAASVHLVAMALWLGGLVLLVACVLARDAHATLVPVLPRFSRLALGCFAILGLTGGYLAWRQSAELAALPATEFGKLLLVKSGIVLVIVGLAFFSRRAVGRMGGDVARRLRRTVLAEAVLGVIVLGVTATLVNASPARVSYAPPLDVTVPSVDGGQVEVHMEPAKQGENVTDIYLVKPDGRLLIPPEITARLLPPQGEDLGPLPVELGSAEPGHYVAQRLTVPFPGRWTLQLAVRTSEIDERVIDVPVRDPVRLALILLLLFPAPAFAHVTVLPESSRPGETVELTFRVPNERDDAATVRLDVFLPPGVPAEVEPHAGWSNAVLGTGEVRWTADQGVSIAPGRTADFKVRLGPLPRQERIVFKSLQHYADGQVVRWIQSSGPDDERPAAVLQLAARTAGESGTSPAVYAAVAAALLGLTGAVFFLRRR